MNLPPSSPPTYAVWRQAEICAQWMLMRVVFRSERGKPDESLSVRQSLRHLAADARPPAKPSRLRPAAQEALVRPMVPLLAPQAALPVAAPLPAAQLE